LKAPFFEVSCSEHKGAYDAAFLQALVKIQEFMLKRNQRDLGLRCNNESKLTVVNGRCVSQSRQLGHCHNKR